MTVLEIVKNAVKGHLEVSEVSPTIFYLYLDYSQLDTVRQLRKTMDFKIYRVALGETCILVVE